jgi:RNA polymerase sigma-70 factor (ECF subfamily)
MTEQRFHSDYLTLAESLYRIAYYILESEAEAEDAVQELYLKLWKMRDALDGIQNPKAYATRLLKNQCIDRIRRASKETGAQYDSADTQYSPDERIDARERLDKVLEAVKALPERQRKILILRTVDGLSYEETARLAGCDYLTCRVLLSRARAKLKTIV